MENRHCPSSARHPHTTRQVSLLGQQVSLLDFKKRAKQLCRYGILATLLGGCSNTIGLPWESPFLDPGRVATREPLEIPPDLSVLPPAGRTQKPQGKVAKLPWERSGSSTSGSGHAGQKTSPQTSANLPFPIPESVDDSSISRDTQEKLPAWME